MDEIASLLPSMKTLDLGRNCYNRIYPGKLIKENQLKNTLSVRKPSLLVKQGWEGGFGNRYVRSYPDKLTREDWRKRD